MAVNRPFPRRYPQGFPQFLLKASLDLTIGFEACANLDEELAFQVFRAFSDAEISGRFHKICPETASAIEYLAVSI